MTLKSSSLLSRLFVLGVAVLGCSLGSLLRPYPASAQEANADRTEVLRIAKQFASLANNKDTQALAGFARSEFFADVCSGIERSQYGHLKVLPRSVSLLDDETALFYLRAQRGQLIAAIPVTCVKSDGGWKISHAPFAAYCPSVPIPGGG